MVRTALSRNLFTRRRFLSSSAAAVAGAGTMSLMPKSGRADGELNILVWCDHTDDKLLQPFAEAHNVKINVKDFQETGAALAILEQSQPGDWDVFVVDSVDVARVAQRGLLDPLPEDQMPWADVFKELHRTDLNYLDGKLYGMPEKFGYHGICFNKAKVDIDQLRTTSAMWDPQFKGRMAVYDYYIPTMEMVGLGIGIAPGTMKEGDLPAVREKLLEIKKLASVIGDVPTVQNALITGAADIIVAGGEFAVTNLTAENPDLDWIIFDDGSVFWTQSICIFSQSPRKALALDFVKYILSPEGQGRLATASCYWAMPANSKADLPDDIKKLLRWDQQPGFLDKSHPYFVPDEALNAKMLEVWTEFLQA
jgi:spermidine/putrescine transport system substrate-binding protein